MSVSTTTLDRASLTLLGEPACREWAALVRELGLAAVARELGIIPQAIGKRVTGIGRSRGHEQP